MPILAIDRYRNEVCRLGFSLRSLKDVIRVFCVDLTAQIRDVVRPTADKRSHEGQAIAAKLCRMPASLAVKRKLWSSRVLGKIACGRGLHLPHADEVSDFSAVYKRITRKPRLASPWLISLLERPSQSYEFRARMQATKALCCQAATTHDMWQGEVRRGSLASHSGWCAHWVVCPLHARGLIEN